jgi:hypothetical protein
LLLANYIRGRLTWEDVQEAYQVMLIPPEGTTLDATHTHRIIPSAEEIPVADAFTGPFDGYVLWLATEGRPKSRATVWNYCYYLREMRSYALQRGLTDWEQLTRAHVRAFLAERRQKVSSSSAAVAHYALKSFLPVPGDRGARGPPTARP